MKTDQPTGLLDSAASDVVDINMNFGLELAHGLRRYPIKLPEPLADVQRRAEYVDQIDQPLLIDGDGNLQAAALGAHLREISDRSQAWMPAVPDPLDRIAVALRLWAGCLMAAKVIATDTRAGENTQEGRTTTFQKIDALAVGDDLFRAGVEVAPAFKARRRERYSLDGVPAGSAVRRAS